MVFEQAGEADAAFAAHLALAEAGIEIGMYDLARDYHYGRGTGADRAAARLWYQRAAEAGHVAAMQVLADHLPYGALGPDDPAAADHWRQEVEGVRRSHPEDD